MRIKKLMKIVHKMNVTHGKQWTWIFAYHQQLKLFLYINNELYTTIYSRAYFFIFFFWLDNIISSKWIIWMTNAMKMRITISIYIIWSIVVLYFRKTIMQVHHFVSEVLFPQFANAVNFFECDFFYYYKTLWANGMQKFAHL